MKHATAPFFLIKTVLLTLAVCALGCKSVRPTGLFVEKNAPEKPDYSKTENWAALPDRNDAADRIPEGQKDGQATAGVDVFFIHPTTFTRSKRGEINWNGDLLDQPLNKKTDRAIEFQATIFNGAARVFAPRYRQTHLQNFYRKDRPDDAKRSLALAHEDVRAAFDFYLKNHNNGRPIIIAGHSQGAYHGLLLLKNYFDEKPLGAQLVAAYLPGWPVPKAFLKNIRPCETPDETGCLCSWRTYKRGAEKIKWLQGPDIIATNPILWTTEAGKCAPKSASKGAVLPKMRIYPQLCDAEVHDGFLWTSRPKFRGSVFIRTKNYHPGDFNLFYLDVRENAALRAGAFLKK